MQLVLLGPPGVGKGTQGRRLAADRGWALISTGDMLRDAIAKRTPLGLEAQKLMDQGLLVPDPVMIGLVRERTLEPDARDALKDTVVPTLTWIPPGYPGYKEGETRFGYDPEKGKAALAEAGFPNGEGLPEIKYTYSSSNPANQARAEYLVQMYQQSLGINLVLDPVEATTLTSMRKSVETHPNVIGGWCADYPDPQNWLSIFWHSRSEFSQSIGYKNAEVDKLIDQADIEIDPEKRMELYDQAQKLVVDDTPYIIRSTSKGSFVVKPYVKGLDITPQDSNTYPGMTTALLNVTIEK